MARNSNVVQAEDRFATLPPSAYKEADEGTEFGWFDRMFAGFDDGKVFQYSDWEARDLAEALKRDTKMRQLEAVLTYPTIRAARSIKALDGGAREHDMIVKFFALDEFSGGMEGSLDLIIDQMTSACVYKKAYFEPKWKRGTGDFAGRAVYRRIGWRPQTVTRSLHDGRTGKIVGWQQDPWSGGTISGNVGIEPPEALGRKALIHVHGEHRDPVNGVSDLEVPYWAYKTKQKIIFLLGQFLENVSLPRVLVVSQDDATSKSVARSIAAAKGSGVIPVNADGRPDSVETRVLDLSGAGADQFMKMIGWLEQSAVNAVMAGFLDLTNAGNGTGMNSSLSSDASDFFLMTLESKNRGIERTVRNGIFAPMVRHNFGPDAKVPTFHFEPLNAEDKSKQVDMLNTILSGRDPSLVPDDFIEALVSKVSDYFGLDGKKLGEAFRGMADKAAKMAEAKSAAAASLPGQNVAKLAGATGAATRAVAAVKTGKDPVKAAKKAAKAAAR